MSEPYPVMLMVRALGPGGSERQLTETARALDRSRFLPHVGCFHANGIRQQELRADGVPIVQIPVRSFRSPATLGAVREMGRYLQSHGIQLVHTFDVPLNLFGAPTARMFGTPLVLSSQRAHRDLTPGLTRHLLRITDQIVDGIVVNCKAMRRHLVEDEKVPSQLVHLCYNGVNTDGFRPRSRLSPPLFSGASVVIGTVTVLRPEKGLSTLLEAFAQVRSLKPGLKLLIVGSGPLLGALKRLSNRLDLGEDCHFEPELRNVADWLQHLDIFVLPSLSEALSNSLMEAMASGLPVIASEVGGNPELVEDRETGLLFSPQDAHDLARALRLLIERPGLRDQLASAGRRLIHERFSRQDSARKMEELYLSLLERAHR